MIDTISTGFTDVLGSTGDTVILRGVQYAGSEPVVCVVHVTRDSYLSAVIGWLNQKAVYYQHYQEFCGVGSIEFSGLVRRPGRVHLETDDGLQSVMAYDAADFSIEMEHG